MALALTATKYAEYLSEHKQMSLSLSASVFAHLLFFIILTTVISSSLNPTFVDNPITVTVEASEARHAEEIKPTAKDDSAEQMRAEPEPVEPAVEPIEQAYQEPPQVEYTNPEPIEAPKAPAPPKPEITTDTTPKLEPIETAPLDLLSETEVFESEVLTASEGSFEVFSPVAAQAAEILTPSLPIAASEEAMLHKNVVSWVTKTLKPSIQPQQLAWRANGQEYQARFIPATADGDMHLETASIEINTERDGEQLTTKLNLNRLAFSNFSQFINRSDSDLQIHNDEYDGRYHSNTRMNIAYSKAIKPKFHGKVTTSASGVNFQNTRTKSTASKRVRNEIFLGGFEARVKKIPLPKKFIPFPEHSAVKESQIHRFEQNATLLFSRDGSYTWHSKDGQTGRREIGNQSVYLIAENKVKLQVSGQLRGKVLVYSPERITITNSLTYAENFGTDNNNNFLGLVSDKYIDIAPPSVTGGGDLTIHAAIYAGRRFTVKRYTHRKESLLHIIGSLTVGSMSPTEPRFRTKIEFDKRLESLRPPGFPMTERYEIESWDNNWSSSSSGSQLPPAN